MPVVVVAATNAEQVALTASVSSAATVAANNTKIVAISVAITVSTTVATASTEVVALTAAVISSTTLATSNTESALLTASISASAAVAAALGAGVQAITGAISAAAAVAAANAETVLLTCAISASAAVTATDAEIKGTTAAITVSTAVSATFSGAATSAWMVRAPLPDAPNPGLSMKLVAKATILRGGNPVANIQTLLPGGTVTLDTTAEQLRQCSFQCIDPTGLLAPPKGLLEPNGVEVALSLAYIVNDRLIGPWSVGIFGISECDDATGTGSTNQVGPTLTITGLDRSANVAASLFTDSLNLPNGTTLSDGILTILDTVMPAWWVAMVNPKIPASSYTMAAQSFQPGDDPWQAIQAIAEAFGMLAYFDSNGRLIVRLTPALSNSNIVLGIQNGAGQIATDVTAAVTNQPGYNGIIVQGTGTSRNIKAKDGFITFVDAPTFTGSAWDSDPTSPTFAYGPYGKRPAPLVQVTSLTSQDQAEDLAETLLPQVLGLSRTVAINMLPIPWLDAFSLIYVNNPTTQVNGTYIVDQATLPLDYSQLHAITAIPVGSPITQLTGQSPSPVLGGTIYLSTVEGQYPSGGALPTAPHFAGAGIFQAQPAGNFTLTSLASGEVTQMGTDQAQGPSSLLPLAALGGFDLLWSGGGQWAVVDEPASQRWDYAGTTQGTGSH